MATIDFKLDELSVPELIALGSRVFDGLNNNGNFPNPNPPLGEFGGTLQKLKDKQEQYSKLRLELNQLKLDRDGFVDQLEKELTAAVNYVQKASGGNEKKILSANLSFEHGADFWPFNDPKQVIELSASGGDQPGVVDLAWDPVRGADGYEIELSQDCGWPEEWKPCGASAQSKTTAQQLLSGHRYWFRVRAVSSKGVGDWSDPVTKYAP